jgi:hypothetical protein
MSNEDWVIHPEYSQNISIEYGVKQTDFELYIASGCCGMPVTQNDSIGVEARCTSCKTTYKIAPFTGHGGELTPYKLYWGRYTWSEVEENISRWVDFYFNLGRGGEVKFLFDGENWKDRKW